MSIESRVERDPSDSCSEHTQGTLQTLGDGQGSRARRRGRRTEGSPATAVTSESGGGSRACLARPSGRLARLAPRAASTCDRFALAARLRAMAGAAYLQQSSLPADVAELLRVNLKSRTATERERAVRQLAKPEHRGHREVLAALRAVSQDMDKFVRKEVAAALGVLSLQGDSRSALARVLRSHGFFGGFIFVGLMS
jgi:hypothetical protein